MALCSLFLVFEAAKHSSLLPFLRDDKLIPLLRYLVDFLPWEVQHRVDDVEDVLVFLGAERQVAEELCHDVADVFEVVLNFAIV